MNKIQFTKAAVVGKNPHSIDFIKNELKKYGFVYEEEKPDFVVSYGGDGMYLISERSYPGIPKVLIRDSKICNKCHDLPLDHVLERIKNGKFKLEKDYKLMAVLPSGESFLAVNEFVLRNEKPTHAYRFDLYINEKQVEKELIGDGIVIATSFGSTGYFYSITRKKFKKGLGVAFNNLTTPKRPLILKNTDELKVFSIRGNVTFSSDNNPDIHIIKEGEIIKFKQSEHAAVRIVVK